MSFSNIYFTYDGRQSYEFPIYIVKPDSGMFTTEISGSRTMQYNKVPYNDEISYYKTDLDTMKFSIVICPLDGLWTEDLKFDLFKWLYSRTPKEFKTTDFMGKLCYCICTNALELTTNGLKQGYMTLNFEATTNYWLGEKTVIPHDLSDITQPTFISSPIYCKTNVMHPLYNDFVYLPNIKIYMKGTATAITLTNYSYNGETFGFTGLTAGETLEIDCSKKKIKSSISSNRINNMINNHNWFKLTYGANRILVSSPCIIEFTIQPPVYI